MRSARALLALGLLACAREPALTPRPPTPAPAERATTATPPKRVIALPASASRVTFARMARSPEPGWNMPRAPLHAPDGRVTYLASERADETLSLYAFDPKTGVSDVILRATDLGSTPTMSREEELRRERQRDRSEGITTYAWAKKAAVLLVPYGGDVYVRRGSETKRLTKTAEPEIDAKICASGAKVGFVRSGELFAVDVATGKETALTKHVEAKTHGLSDYVAQEELGEPSGWSWSPTCDRVAFLEVDESAVDKVAVLGYRNEAPDLMMQRYPRAGSKNPAVRAGVVDLATGRTRFITLPHGGEHYLGRFGWAPDGSALYFQTLTRDQKRLALVRFDPKTGGVTELAHESSSAWITLSPFRVLEKSGELLFTSVRSGHRHVELRSERDGALIRTLTRGDWDVDTIAGANEERVFLSGTKDGFAERHLYAVALAGGEPTRLTPDRGTHAVKLDDAGTTWIDVHSALDRPPRADVVRGGTVVGQLGKSDPEIAALDLRSPRIVQVPAGEETLNALLLEPRELRGQHPVVVMVYGGPESQAVFDSWSARLLWQHLADRGFVVFQLDNRGTGGRGRAFAEQVHKRLGVLELEDQIAGARWLAQQPFVDGSRIGIYGHSYGGFMSAAAMLAKESPFSVGVAGSPVTDWRLYDTGYTERYMETPQTNAAGYAETDLAKRAAHLHGKLLLTHALMDENVHFAHTARLVDALVAAGKHFDLFVLPGERHGVRAPAARAYMPEKIARYFVDNL